MKLYRLNAILSLLLVAYALSGCGFKDIDKRFFAVAVAVDPADNPERLYKITVKLAIPSPSERFGSNDYTLVSEETDSIAEAVRKIKSKIDKELDLGHLKAIVIGKAIVEKGDVNRIMDWFIRRRDVQNIAWVAVGNPTGKDVLDLKPPTERLPSNMLFMSFGQVGTETAYIVSEYLFDFRRRLKERGLDPILPVIQPRTEQQVLIDRVSVLDKEKQRLLLGPLETKILNSFYIGVGKYDIHVNMNGGFFIIAAENVRGTFAVHNRQGRAVVQLTVRIHGIIEEASVPINKDDLPRYERTAEEQVKQRVLELFRKFQKAGVDPVGLGLRYRARHTGDPEQVWKEWQQLYPDAEFEVTPHVRLKSTGQLG